MRSMTKNEWLKSLLELPAEEKANALRAYADWLEDEGVDPAEHALVRLRADFWKWFVANNFKPKKGWVLKYEGEDSRPRFVGFSLSLSGLLRANDLEKYQQRLLEEERLVQGWAWLSTIPLDRGPNILEDAEDEAAIIPSDVVRHMPEDQFGDSAEVYELLIWWTEEQAMTALWTAYTGWLSERAFNSRT